MSTFQDRYAKRLEEERRVKIYYIPVTLGNGSKEYVYAAASALLHDQFVAALEYNQLPDFAVVIAYGEGEPTDEIKQKMKTLYGFEHDAPDNDNIIPKQKPLE